MIQSIETDLGKIQKSAKQKEEENWEFRLFLKGSNYSSQKIDQIVHTLFQDVSSNIDCTKCANCCREVRPVLKHSDIERLTKGLNISAVQFKEQYLIKCNEGKGFWFKTKPCPFLRDNRCSQYPLRPAVCKSFPHLHKKDFVFRLINVIGNYAICPIVFNVYEGLKGGLWHKKAETTDGNPPQGEGAFEEKFIEWQQRNWMKWLQDNLSFPFIAERTDDNDDAYFSPAIVPKVFRLGHKMKVLSLVDEDDLYGIVVKVREGRKVGYVPLCDLKVLSQKDRNYWPVREYSIWFANR